MQTGHSARAWGAPPWPKHASQSDRDLRPAEVLIIGGGLTGLSAAYHLAKQGCRTALFESVAFGAGASGRTGGLVLEGTANGTLPGTEQTLTLLKTLVELESISCDLELGGCWEIEHRHGVQELPWNDEGAPVRIAGTVDGGTVNPVVLLSGIAAAAVRKGASLYENTSVRRVLPGSRPAIELDSGIIEAEFVILAANAWNGILVPNLPPTYAALTYACATEPLDRDVLESVGLGTSSKPFYTLDLPYLWGRKLPGGQLMFGSGLTFDRADLLESLDVRTGRARAPLVELEQRVRKLHPALSKVKFSTSWGGPIAFPDDRPPLLGQLPGFSSVLVAGAYSGHGVALSVWAGRRLARAITSRESLPEWGALPEAKH